MKGATQVAPAPAEKTGLAFVLSELKAAAVELQAEVEAGAIAAGKLTAVNAAIAALEKQPGAASPPEKAKRRKATKPTARRATAKPGRKPKASKRAKPERAAKGKEKPKRAAPSGKLGPDEPRVAMGRLPSAQTHPCTSEEDRRAKVAELRERGLRRCDPLERLSAGTYDVRRVGDGDVILWIDKAED